MLKLQEKKIIYKAFEYEEVIKSGYVGKSIFKLEYNGDEKNYRKQNEDFFNSFFQNIANEAEKLNYKNVVYIEKVENKVNIYYDTHDLERTIDEIFHIHIEMSKAVKILNSKIPNYKDRLYVTQLCNLQNTAYTTFKLKYPFNKKYLVVGDEFQSIENEIFKECHIMMMGEKKVEENNKKIDEENSTGEEKERKIITMDDVPCSVIFIGKNIKNKLREVKHRKILATIQKMTYSTDLQSCIENSQYKDGFGIDYEINKVLTLA